MNSGIDNAQRPGILHGGLGWINLAIDPRKSQLLDSRRFGLIEMANLLACRRTRSATTRERRTAVWKKKIRTI